MVKLAIVGSLNVDLVARTPRLPIPGETILGSTFLTAFGGKGANQAVAAARLGAQVEMIGRVGGDSFGDGLLMNLQTSRVSTDGVAVDPVAPTGVAIIEVEESGQNTIIVVPGANSHLSPADVDSASEAIRSAQALVTQLEIPLETVIRALQVARQARVLTVLNPAPAQPLDATTLGLVDILVPNETEASQLTGIAVNDMATAEQAARELNHRGAGIVIITLGARGSLVLENGKATAVAPYHVPAVDATAAGDAFVAALALSRANGQDLESAVRTASAAGALAATKLGAQPSLPTRQELAEFLQKEMAR